MRSISNASRRRRTWAAAVAAAATIAAATIAAAMVASTAATAAPSASTAAQAEPEGPFKAVAAGNNVDVRHPRATTQSPAGATTNTVKPIRRTEPSTRSAFVSLARTTPAESERTAPLSAGARTNTERCTCLGLQGLLRDQVACDRHVDIVCGLQHDGSVLCWGNNYHGQALAVEVGTFTDASLQGTGTHMRNPCGRHHPLLGQQRVLAQLDAPSWIIHRDLPPQN